MPDPSFSWSFDVSNISAILGILGVSVGGVLLLVWRVFLQRAPLELSWAVRSTELLSAEESVFPDEVQVFYRDTPIKGLVKFSYIFWNSGNGVLRREDIASRGPLRLVFPKNSGLLRMKASRVSDTIYRADSHGIEEGLGAEFTFEYLDPDKGFAIEALCSESLPPPEPTGTIKGAGRHLKKGRYDERQGPFVQNSKNGINFMISASVGILTSLVIIFTATGFAEFLGFQRQEINFAVGFMFTTSSLVMTAWAVCYVGIAVLRRFVRVKNPYAPKHLRDQQPI